MTDLATTFAPPSSSTLLGRVITIDGPSGAGKSSSAAGLAQRLRVGCLNSGSLYRAVAWKVLAVEIDPNDQPTVEAFCRSIRIRLSAVGFAIWIDDTEATPHLRLPEVTQASSIISAFPCVRQSLLSIQRDMAKQAGLVAEGRDMGTVVFPHADVKFYLDADPQARSLRQYTALPVQGIDRNLHRSQVIQRDLQDSQREVAPLRPAQDAILLDSTQMTPEAVIDRMLHEIRRVIGVIS